MTHQTINIEETGVKIQLSSFTAGTISEHHAILCLEPRNDTFEQQFARICDAETHLMDSPDMSGAQPLFKRYFLSDATNQVPVMKDAQCSMVNGQRSMVNGQCTISYIQQPPLNGSKLALWIYLVKDLSQSDGNVQCSMLNAQCNSSVFTHNGYSHIWTMGLYNTTADTSYMQTWETLFRYIAILKDFNATLEANCLRTWFFVRDVDTQYNGLVKARRECFAEQGLTTNTHYIASTGIGGTPADPKAIIQLGAYALTGFRPEQQRYLYAPTHLNRTSDYGVTFERGTLMQYGDRDHVYISGTASIDNHGEVIHVGDIRKQTIRMWENVEKLLEEGGMTYGDVMQIIVYLRDCADYNVVKDMFIERFPDIPFVITLAPVCRPTWLVEMECIAVKAARNEQFPDF
ncbi:MAG: hypothetical protein J5678_07155 [Bacteroidaceae bacterium]|nr:hypothetical protein [Bacteroidaceae bacterium]